MIGTTLAHYRIVEMLGAGGMGEVYKAHDERLDRDVALKVLPSGTLADDQARRRFRREALALSSLNHPNIATVHDFDSQAGVDFIVMELVEGVSLAEKVKAGPLTEEEVSRLGAQIAGALEEAHERGIIHRDLKPDNVAVTPKGRAKVLDFGLARMIRPVDEEATTEAFTEGHQVAGTLPYMSPEELRGRPADHRSDLYSLGVVLYEIAAGRRPFRHTLPTAMADAIIHEPPEAPRALNRKVSAGLESIILKAVDKEPDHRYQSAREMRVDLERLVAPVSVAHPEKTSPRTGRWLWGLAALVGIGSALTLANVAGLRDTLTGAAGRPVIESIAVLPLENLSGDPEQEYFVDGMTDELIGQLAQIAALKVISRTSVMQYKGARRPLPEIAQELSVDAIVEGTVRRAEGRVRITAQLIDAATDQHLWSQSYERDLSGMLALQSEVARAIAQEIRVTLTPREEAQLRAGPVDPVAYDAFLRGRFRWSTDNVPGFKRAIEYFNEAIRRDPGLARAHAGLADAYAQLEMWGALLPGEGFAKARQSAQRSLDIDDTLADAHASLGYIKMVFEWDWHGAERHLERALELDPNSANAHERYAILLSSMGRHDEAVREAEKARQLAPLDSRQAAIVGMVCHYARRYPAAIEHLQEALEMEPDRWNTHFFLAQAFTAKNAMHEATGAAEKAVSLSDRRSSWALAQLGLVYGLSGKTSRAQAILGELRERRDQGHVPAQTLARVYVGLGENDRAFEWLEKAYEERIFMSNIAVLPLWDPLREDPRFQDLVRRVGLPR